MNSLKLSLYLWSALLMIFPRITFADNYSFDSELIDGQNGDADVSLFNLGIQQPGEYYVNVNINGERVDYRKVKFNLVQDINDRPILQPCLSIQQLAEYGLKTNELDFESDGCFNLSLNKQVQNTFDFDKQRLELFIPQSLLLPRNQGISPEALWDDGVSALLVNYQVDAIKNNVHNSKNGRSESRYIQLSPGINIGSWRLRNMINWQKNGDGHGYWENSYVYATKGLNNIQSRITLGQTNTSSDIFDSLPLEGGILSSDENMVPNSLREFTPFVRGVARGQAKVEIRQNGNLIFNTVVPPGPFYITNLQNASNGVNLEVTVKEGDGSEQQFVVPYISPPVALHQGYMKYSLAAGRYYYNSSVSRDDLPLGQASIMYGLPWNLTLFGGQQWAEGFGSTAAGIGLMLGKWGGISADLSDSRTKKQHGQAWRFRYLWSDDSGLSLSLSERWSSRGVATLQNVAESMGYIKDKNYDAKIRNEESLSLNLSTPEWGSLSLNAQHNNYWAGEKGSISVGMGYSIMLPGSITANINYSEQHLLSMGNRNKDKLLNLSLSIPLEHWLAGTSASFQTSSATNSSSQQFALQGQALDRKMNWSLQQEVQTEASGSQRAFAMNANYRGRYAEGRANYSQSNYMTQSRVGVSGGMLLHEYGLTVGQTMDDTIALIRAPGVAGAAIGYIPGQETDFRGYATMKGLSVYQNNNINIDPLSLPDNASIEQTEIKVVPTFGAVVLADFNTRIGRRALIKLRREGKPVPFGAVVSMSDDEHNSAVVSDDGQVYLTGVQPDSVLLVKWGQGKNCKAKVILSNDENSQRGITSTTLVCR